jgi:hypothetical protein
MGDEITWKEKVAELIESVADMKIALVTANDTIHAKGKIGAAPKIQVVISLARR